MTSTIRTRQALVNLGPWLARCAAAGVPYVAAEFSPVFPVSELLLAAELCDPAAVPALMAANSWRLERVAEAGADGVPVMCRWECCASADLKHRMARARGYDALVMAALCVDDPRLWDCLASADLRMCVRPWVAAAQVAGYPVEFRVFYGPDGYEGVSNYYPQRALPDNGDTWVAVAMVQAYAARLWQHARFPVGFTADFLVVAGDPVRVVFLEGGPPHVLGEPVSAHPCCFRPGEVRGVALAQR